MSSLQGKGSLDGPGLDRLGQAARLRCEMIAKNDTKWYNIDRTAGLFSASLDRSCHTSERADEP